MKNIIITEGDPTGISYELFDDSFDFIKKKSIKYNFILVSNQTKIRSKFQSEIISLNNISELKSKISLSKKNSIFSLTKNLLTKKQEDSLVLGKPSICSGRISFASLMTGIQLQKKIGGDIITLPLSKEWVIASGEKSFKGHTEVFAKEYNKKTFMLMYGKKLKVIPLTTHIPLQSVSSSLKTINIYQLVTAIQNSNLFKSLKIAFCGLNPHAGENGKIGREEIDIINPYIQTMKKMKIDVDGPISADSLFIPDISKKYDLIFACYHDQGLIPFKSLEGKNGINLTLGLDFLRVSPDHGTAFDIAGKGIAESGSLIQCIKVLTR
ncbi:MAG: 4-hydroxythreonine-4-phosphate dehydrogenase PdxA [Leptospiraceae bacterium]|nr:4-hydroxythreonine-4-phosphate dehydrogenase PdxA [Leptospiraceae bacterium]